MSRGAGVDYCVAPHSLRAWFDAFVARRPFDRVFFLGEDRLVDATARETLEREDAVARRAIIYSGHYSLDRDILLAAELAAKGREVFVQTRECAILGTDKVKLKQVLDQLRIATPLWGTGQPPPDRSGEILVKSRHGTQSEGLHWYDSAFPLQAHEYWEQYVFGTEYSVLAYVDERGICIFPPIWKGRVQRDLTPPWRRLRLCPSPPAFQRWEQPLLLIVDEFLAAVPCRGFIEFEFVINDTLSAFLLEINPRVSGVMRIAAMATGIRIFSMPLEGMPGAAPIATRFAAEVPYDGPPWSSSDGNVFATSRLTVAASTLTELYAMLQSAVPRGETWARHISQLYNG
jgi:hypothetical protein